MPSRREQGQFYLLLYAERLEARISQALYPLNYRLDDTENWVRFQTGARDSSPSKASMSALQRTHLPVQHVAVCRCSKAAGDGTPPLTFVSCLGWEHDERTCNSSYVLMEWCLCTGRISHRTKLDSIISSIVKLLYRERMQQRRAKTISVRWDQGTVR
jgi:hypothetical protein